MGDAENDNTGKHKAGPNLFGIFGKKSGTTPGYKFSEANMHYGTWNDDSFDKFIEAPAKTMPGNRMQFPGLKKEQERQDLTAYLKSVK